MPKKSMVSDEVYRRQVISIRKGIKSLNNQSAPPQTSLSSEENLFNLTDFTLKTGSI
jgi:hypothetical protein